MQNLCSMQNIWLGICAAEGTHAPRRRGRRPAAQRVRDLPGCAFTRPVATSPWCRVREASTAGDALSQLGPPPLLGPLRTCAQCGAAYLRRRRRLPQCASRSCYCRQNLESSTHRLGWLQVQGRVSQDALSEAQFGAACVDVTRACRAHAAQCNARLRSRADGAGTQPSMHLGSSPASPRAAVAS